MSRSRQLYNIEDYPHVYIGRTDEYYNEEDDDDSVFGHSYEWWTWSEDADDSDFANEGPVFELTEDGKEDFFDWLDAEQVGPNLGNGRMKDWPKEHLSSEEEWEYLTDPKNGLSKEHRMNESRRPRGRMLKESSIDWSRMPTIPQDQIDAVEAEIRQKYNTWDERTQESADIVLNALDFVNGEIESCKANEDLGEDLELIVSAICGGGYSEISLLDLDNEIDASALEDFISDVLDKNESRSPRGRMLREKENSSEAWEDPRTLEDFIEELEDLRFHSKNLTQKQYTLMIELTNFLKKLSQKMKG